MMDDDTTADDREGGIEFPAINIPEEYVGAIFAYTLTAGVVALPSDITDGGIKAFERDLRAVLEETATRHGAEICLAGHLVRELPGGKEHAERAAGIVMRWIEAQRQAMGEDPQAPPDVAQWMPRGTG